jgi:hypothetical protein
MSLSRKNRYQLASTILVAVSKKEAVVLADCYMTLDSLASWAAGNPNRINTSHRFQIVHWHFY